MTHQQSPLLPASVTLLGFSLSQSQLHAIKSIGLQSYVYTNGGFEGTRCRKSLIASG